MPGKNECVFTAKDLLSVESMFGSILLAGQDALEKRVTRVNVVEVPDIVNWVRPGVFLITTGYPFKDNQQYLADVLSPLVERGVAALGLKPKRFIDAISQEVIDEAAALSLPLFELAPDTNFSDID